MPRAERQQAGPGTSRGGSTVSTGFPAFRRGCAGTTGASPRKRDEWPGSSPAHCSATTASALRYTPAPHQSVGARPSARSPYSSVATRSRISTRLPRLSHICLVFHRPNTGCRPGQPQSASAIKSRGPITRRRGSVKWPIQRQRHPPLSQRRSTFGPDHEPRNS